MFSSMKVEERLIYTAMTLKYLFSMFLLASSLGWTPGPNNALMAASGARFGYVRTLPHTLGVIVGFPLMMFIIALGLGGVFQSFPILREILRYAGALVLLWTAWQVATAGMGKKKGKEAAKPWNFWQGAAFQWVNPKAWVMCVSIGGQLPDIGPVWYPPLVISLVFGLAGLFSANGWTLFGSALQKFLSTPLRFRVFNLVMAGLIVLTIIGILFADLHV